MLRVQRGSFNCINTRLQDISRLCLPKRYSTTDHATIKPLEGIRVLELGQIKIEPPKTGDPLRKWRGLDHDGQSPWFRSMARNKKSVCIDLRSEEGRKLVKQLALKSDVLIENFKPGTMEKWGLGPENIYPENPKLVYTRISGYGQTGPYSKKPGFASVCEGMGGFRFINGHPGQPPVRPNLSLGDSLAGMHAALGTLLGLIARNKLSHQSRTGQVVDVAIYESMFNMMEGIVPEYDRFQEIRQPSGTTLTGIVPTNTYPCQDGKHVIIGGNGDSIYVRLMNAIGRPDLTGDDYKTNMERWWTNIILADWTSKHSADEIIEALEKASVPAGKIYDAKDMVEDEHINARGMIEDVTVGTQEEGKGWNLKIPGMSPVLETTPGGTKWPGPDLGAHTDQVLKELLSLSEKQLQEYSQTGITGGK
ncbi:hypothetical protein CU098_007421 [Rhizopus stolonifer]|uniref:Uncharacterized protein n=1 Tax=Rhizopus stolonifer TaxID=4846 RepID=A0A367KP93_RHIST|nr:hypothetical protein CU098_007421 [Rhizopus stolonifer]